MLESRAIDIVKSNGLQRLLKRFKFQSSPMKKLITDLFYKVLNLAKEVVDVAFLVNLTLCPYQELRNAGMKAFCEVTEVADLERVGSRHMDQVDIKFQVHIPYIIQCSQRKQNPVVFRNYALQTLANLASREYLKSFIMFNKGLEALTDAVKDTENVQGMRIAAHGLTNLAQGDENLKVKLMEALRAEIDRAWKGDEDPVVAAYLKKMLKEGIEY